MKVQIKWPVGICEALVFGRGVALYVYFAQRSTKAICLLYGLERVLQPDIAFQQYFTHFGQGIFFGFPPLHLISRELVV